MPSTITIGNPAGKGQKEIQTRYPVEEGLTAGTQTQVGRISNLVPEINSLVSRKDKFGL